MTSDELDSQAINEAIVEQLQEDSQAINEAIIERLQDVIQGIKENRWRVEEATGTGNPNAMPGRHEYLLMVRLSCDSMAGHRHRRQD